MHYYELPSFVICKVFEKKFLRGFDFTAIKEQQQLSCPCLPI